MSRSSSKAKSKPATVGKVRSAVLTDKNTKPLRLVIAGGSGRMGAEIKALALVAPKQWELVGEISRSSKFEIRPGSCDVIIDFSSPDLLESLLKKSVSSKIPYVCGTTGFSSAQLKLLPNASKSIPVFHAANMSVGVAVFKRMLSELKSLVDYDFHIHEIHHRHKKDRPSGTALWLHEALKSAIGRDVEISVERGGGVFGIHEVRAMGPEEVLTIQHSALNRAVFARGALQAAQWLVHQSSGLYGMDDLLK